MNLLLPSSAVPRITEGPLPTDDATSSELHIEEQGCVTRENGDTTMYLQYSVTPACDIEWVGVTKRKSSHANGHKSACVSHRERKMRTKKRRAAERQRQKG